MLHWMYLASAASASFTLVGLPIMVRHLPSAEWDAVAISISVLSIYVSFDLGSNFILGRGIIDFDKNRFMSDRRRYAIVGIFVCVLVSFYVGIKSAIFSYGDIFSISGFVRGVLILMTGSAFYFVQQHVSSLNGLRFNAISSRNAIFGNGIRWLGPLSCLAGVDTSALLVISLLFSGYFFEIIAARIYLQRILVEAADGSACSNESRNSWVEFGRNALMLSAGAIVSQIDKFVLLGSVPSSEFSLYVLMTAFCQIPLLFQYPFQRYLLPRYEKFSLNGTGIKLYAAIALLATNFLFSMLLPTLFEHWSGVDLTDSEFLTLFFLAFGGFLSCIYSYISNFLVAKNLVYYVFIANCVALLAGLLTLNLTFGIRSGAYAWIAIAATQISCCIVAQILHIRANKDDL